MCVTKRLTDIVLSLIGIVICMPLSILVALLIKLDSRGPVFYLGDRVGKDMEIFKMYKFRTMMDMPFDKAYSVCAEYDPRVTTFGRFLRRTKMNEIPQLINILKGEMSFVGPRPEAPDLAAHYPEEAKEIFSVNPGLVSPATILGRNEEEFYPHGVDTKAYYINEILPRKVAIDLEYIKKSSLFKDLQYIFMGVKETLLGAVRKKHIYHNLSQILLLLADTFLILCSCVLAAVIYSRNAAEGFDWLVSLAIIFVATIILLMCNIYFGLYNCLIRYISRHDILGVFKGVTLGIVFFLLVAWVIGLDGYWKTIAAISWGLMVFTLSGLRICLRLYWDKMNPETWEKEKRRILICGAGDAGHAAYRALNLMKKSPFEVVGFIDDAPNKYGKKLSGVKVLGSRHQLEALVNLYRVEEVLLTTPNANIDELNELVEICQKIGLKYRIFTSLGDVDTLGHRNIPFRALEFNDMLPREKIQTDPAAIKRVLDGRTVLLNGTGGALGMELCRQVLKAGCQKLIIVDRYESYLNELVASLSDSLLKNKIIPVLLETGRIDALEDVFENHRPNIVFHAGMRKHTPFLPLNLDDVVQANYVRTFSLAKSALRFKCEHFVMISSLMAAQNTNLISDSLRVAEVSLKHFFSDGSTRLSIVRICDIIENRGGIVSIIDKQIREQQTVTLPSPDTQIYLMSKYSATALILKSLTGTNEINSENRVFSCKPGTSMPLSEIVGRLAKLYGMKISVDSPIKCGAELQEDSKSGAKGPWSSVPIYTPGFKVMKGDMGNEKDDLKSIFKEFVLNNIHNPSLKEWVTQTRKLIKLCEPDIFVKES